MNQDDAEFLKKLQAAFRVEAEEHLHTISSGLLELEKTPEPNRRTEIVASIFRDAHSLKGAARAVNAGEIESICQSLENVFSDWRRNDIVATPELFDPLHMAVNAVAAILCAVEGDVPGLSAEETALLLAKLARLEHATTALTNEVNSALEATPSAPTARERKRKRKLASDTAEPTTPRDPGVLKPEAPSVADPAPVTAHQHSAQRGPTAAPATHETVRISTEKLDGVLLQVEEMLTVKLTARQRAADLRQLLDGLALWQRQWSKLAPELRATLHSIEKAERENPRLLTLAPVAKLTEFMEWSDEQTKSLHARLTAVVKASDHDRRSTATMVDTLLEDTKKLLMLPCSTLLEAFPKMVRDLSRDQVKEVDLVMQGGDVEIDKRVLGEMRDPLIHLLRNAVDHGIEEPRKRELAGKIARATIHVAVCPVDGNKIQIVVSDDGGGIDRTEVREAAIRHKVITPESAGVLSEQETLALIFRPEVSTSRMITEISGRGLGLSIVKEKVERLGGRVEMETKMGTGTTFRLHLPLTLATFRGLLVHCAGQPFVIPAANVERVLRVSSAEVRTVEMRETIPLNGKVVSLVRLSDVLRLVRPPEPAAAGQTFPLAVLAAGELRIAFRVDAILNEQEVLVKRLGKPLVRVRNVAGATVLGNGKAVPILNVEDLLKSAGKTGGRPDAKISSTSSGDGSAVEPGVESTVQLKSILVVEDSITARMLVKNILEAAGYVVKTAVDGLDALTMLKTADFDVVVSDVEMPRMNGFQLTEKIRADARLSDLPVVLVTALASREDRERGVDAGANAYIVKNSFDQGNLLEIIQRLL